MSQKAASINHATGSSKKCFHCGLRNFPDKNRCQRCNSDLSPPVQMARRDQQMRDISAELHRSTFRFAWIFAALLVGSVVFIYMRQDPRGTPEVRSEAVVGETATPSNAEQPGQTSVEEESQSQAAATQIVTDLKLFQQLAESGMDYNDYARKLESLKANLNGALPSFVGHRPSDETFREEVSAMLRDYTAAGNWWKTTLTNSAVFTEADRDERTRSNFESARTHLANVEKTLTR